MNIPELVKMYKEARPDYRYRRDIFADDPERVARCKWLVETELNVAERTIMILYAETGSIGALAKLLDCPKSTLHLEVVRIQKKLRELYNKQKTNDNSVH